MRFISGEGSRIETVMAMAQESLGVHKRTTQVLGMDSRDIESSRSCIKMVRPSCPFIQYTKQLYNKGMLKLGCVLLYLEAYWFKHCAMCMSCAFL